MLPCQVSRRRRHLDSDLWWRWRSRCRSGRGAGLKRFLHILNQDSAAWTCPLHLGQIDATLLGQTACCWHDLGSHRRRTAR